MSASTVKQGRPSRDTHGVGQQAPTAHNPTPNGRDRQGRFAPGNAGGPGNPFARQVAALRSALIEAVTPDDMRAIALELLTQAKCGHLAAMKLLLSYVIGRPTPAPNPDAVELDEWQLRRQAPTAAEATDTLFERRPPSLVNAAARAVAVVHQQEVLDLLQPDPPGPEDKPAGRTEVAGEAGARTDLLQAVVGRLGLATDPAAVTNRDFGRPDVESADRLRLIEALLRTAADASGRPTRRGEPVAGPSGERDRR